MKFRWDKKYLYAGVTAFVVAACVLLLYWIVTDWNLLFSGLKKVLKVLDPVIYGLVFAFLLAPICNWTESRLFLPLAEQMVKKNPQSAPKLARGFSVTFSMLFGIAVVAAIIGLILPQTYTSIKTIIVAAPEYIEDALARLEKWVKSDSELESQLLAAVNSVYNGALNWLKNGLVPRVDDIVLQVTAGLVSVVSVVFNMIVGAVIAVYLLVSKETFLAQCKKAIYSLFSRHAANEIIKTSSFTYEMFGNFITARLIDGAIIGIINYIAMLLLGMPYPELISVIIGVTNIIPFFGPFIGAIPSVLLILIVDPVKSLIFAVFILVLQQVDGNIIGPALLGSKTGISSFWVIIALLAGGGLFGFVGMVCAVPLFAVVYTMLKRAGNESLVKKGLSETTADYNDLAYVDEETGAHVKKVQPPRGKASRRKKAGESDEAISPKKR